MHTAIVVLLAFAIALLAAVLVTVVRIRSLLAIAAAAVDAVPASPPRAAVTGTLIATPRAFAGDVHLVTHEERVEYHGPDEAHAKRVAEQLAQRGVGRVARFHNGSLVEVLS